MKVYKDLLVKINGQEYVVAYKTKLGFITEIHMREITNRRQLDTTKTSVCSTREVQVELIKASTFKDLLNYYLFNMGYKLRKKYWKW